MFLYHRDTLSGIERPFRSIDNRDAPAPRNTNRGNIIETLCRENRIGGGRFLIRCCRARARAERSIAGICFRFINSTMAGNSADLPVRFSLPTPIRQSTGIRTRVEREGLLISSPTNVCKTGIPDRKEWTERAPPAGRRDIFRYVNKYKVDRRAFLGYKGLGNCPCIIGAAKLLTAERRVREITRRPKVSRRHAMRRRRRRRRRRGAAASAKRVWGAPGFTFGNVAIYRPSCRCGEEGLGHQPCVPTKFNSFVTVSCPNHAPNGSSLVIRKKTS